MCASTTSQHRCFCPCVPTWDRRLQDPQPLQDAIDSGNAPRLALLLQHPQLDSSGARLLRAVGVVPAKTLALLATKGYNVNVQREEGCLLVHRAVQVSAAAAAADQGLV